MKTLSFVALFVFSFAAVAQTLPEYRYTLTDVLTRGQTKDTLFSGLNRTLVKTGSSICSNRALIWTYDMKRNHNINAAKIFLFYTGKNGEIGSKKWWYHVAPVINEGGQIWVIDGGFSGFVKRPMLVSEWLTKFVDTPNCKVIESRDHDLFERMFAGRMYPEYTPEHGQHDCYTVITPGMFWTPATVAMGALQQDSEGRPIRFTRDEYDMSELLQACKEAAAGRLGSVFGGQKKKCQEYLGLAKED
ncbi:MAG: protein-glutamine glutaminase family protein [Bdellovibrionota bacterium]